MSKPTKCYAVTSGEYSDYEVHAIYRRREDAEARVKTNNETPVWLLDGEPYYGPGNDLPRVQQPNRAYLVTDLERVTGNPAREEHLDMRVEEFDYYEGEPLPAPLEGENKHDSSCLRRKAEMGWQYLCTCSLSDEQVDSVVKEKRKQ
jgi:hypothetical protein